MKINSKIHFIINQNVMHIKITTNLKCVLKNINKTTWNTKNSMFYISNLYL